MKIISLSFGSSSPFHNNSYVCPVSFDNYFVSSALFFFPFPILPITADSIYRANQCLIKAILNRLPPKLSVNLTGEIICCIRIKRPLTRDFTNSANLFTLNRILLINLFSSTTYDLNFK
jgi:hypothetical protein